MSDRYRLYHNRTYSDLSAGMMLGGYGTDSVGVGPVVRRERIFTGSFRFVRGQKWRDRAGICFNNRLLLSSETIQEGYFVPLEPATFHLHEPCVIEDNHYIERETAYRAVTANGAARVDPGTLLSSSNVTFAEPFQDLESPVGMSTWTEYGYGNHWPPAPPLFDSGDLVPDRAVCVRRVVIPAGRPRQGHYLLLPSIHAPDGGIIIQVTCQGKTTVLNSTSGRPNTYETTNVWMGGVRIEYSPHERLFEWIVSPNGQSDSNPINGSVIESWSYTGGGYKRSTLYAPEFISVMSPVQDDFIYYTKVSAGSTLDGPLNLGRCNGKYNPIAVNYIGPFTDRGVKFYFNGTYDGGIRYSTYLVGANCRNDYYNESEDIWWEDTYPEYTYYDHYYRVAYTGPYHYNSSDVKYIDRDWKWYPRDIQMTGCNSIPYDRHVFIFRGHMRNNHNYYASPLHDYITQAELDALIARFPAA